MIQSGCCIWVQEEEIYKKTWIGYIYRFGDNAIAEWDSFCQKWLGGNRVDHMYVRFFFHR